MPKAVQLEKKLLHYVSKAIADYNLIQTGDKVMVCLSGGKDSFTLLYLLKLLRERKRHSFDIFAFTLDQGHPGWDDNCLQAWLTAQNIPFEIRRRNTYAVVKEKIPAGKTYCALCSRLRRGNIYDHAQSQGFTKIALGHHRDDLITSLLMSILYNGEIRSMPPKLLTDNKQHIVIRPLVYCQETDIAAYAQIQAFPLIPCNLCGSQENLVRKKVRQLINELAKANPKIPSNMLHALSHIKPSQLMDLAHWPFKELEQQRNLLIPEISNFEQNPVRNLDSLPQ